jgi:hypothetical protein
MIGKVVRGSHAGGLLRYLYGPGRANEHIRPHLVAGFGDPAELEPDRRPDGAPDLRRLAGLLAQPLAPLGRPGYDKPVALLGPRGTGRPGLVRHRVGGRRNRDHAPHRPGTEG